MKQLTIFKLLMGVLIVMTSSSAFSAQVRIADKDAEIAGVISATEVSRITVEGDRIVSLATVPKGYSVDHDTETGDLYLVPQQGGLAGLLINMFITSESGRSFQLLLQVRDIPSEQIIIRVPSIISDEGAKRAVKAPRREELARLIRAVITGDLLGDYQRTAVESDGTESIHPDITTQEIWQGPAFTALRITVHGDKPPAALGKIVPRAAATWLSGDGRNGVIVFDAFKEADDE
jgi:hypothetical protein